MKHSAMDRVALAIATWFGCGYFPFGPGTVGSAAALLIACWVHAEFGWTGLHFAALGIATLPISIWASSRAERLFGGKDPGRVVVDEVAGQWVTLAGAATLDWKPLLAAFLLFRLFDIAKPFPVRRFERLRGGTGIMADDIAAGIYAAVVLWAGSRFGLY